MRSQETEVRKQDSGFRRPGLAFVVAALAVSCSVCYADGSVGPETVVDPAVRAQVIAEHNAALAAARAQATADLAEIENGTAPVKSIPGGVAVDISKPNAAIAFAGRNWGKILLGAGSAYAAVAANNSWWPWHKNNSDANADSGTTGAGTSTTGGGKGNVAVNARAESGGTVTVLVYSAPPEQ